jgi:undecaprenyl pyrophosphate phosphatase UppP
MKISMVLGFRITSFFLAISFIMFIITKNAYGHNNFFQTYHIWLAFISLAIALVFGYFTVYKQRLRKKKDI